MNRNIINLRILKIKAKFIESRRRRSGLKRIMPSDKKIRTSACVCVIVGCILLFCVWPNRFAKHYDYIERDKIYEALVAETTRNISIQRLDECDYIDILEENNFMFTETYQEKIFDSQEVRLGGEYHPEECRPRFSSAIIIPYRQREQQLSRFLITCTIICANREFTIEYF